MRLTCTGAAATRLEVKTPVAEEATRDLLEPAFFAEHSVAELAEHSDHWLGKQGRIVPPMVRRRDAQSPTGKMGDAWDIAHAVLFLASDEARYITATELVVDGGLTATAGAG